MCRVINELPPPGDSAKGNIEGQCALLEFRENDKALIRKTSNGRRVVALIETCAKRTVKPLVPVCVV